MAEGLRENHEPTETPEAGDDFQDGHIARFDAFRDDPDTEEEMIEWIAQLLADRAVERMKANEQR